MRSILGSFCQITTIRVDSGDIASPMKKRRVAAMVADPEEVAAEAGAMRVWLVM